MEGFSFKSRNHKLERNYDCKGEFIELKVGRIISILNNLASQLERRDEEPNIELARELVSKENIEGIQEFKQR